MALKHFTSTVGFSRENLDAFFQRVDGLKTREGIGGVPESLSGKVIYHLFFGDSARTWGRFEAAATRLGARVTGTTNASQMSSVISGGSLRDAVRMCEGYGDIFVIKHPEVCATRSASEVATAPVISAGDGSEHPTQALTDLYTMTHHVGELDGKKIALVGNLRDSSSVASLVNLLALHDDLTVYGVSPRELALPVQHQRLLQERNFQVDTGFTRVTQLPKASFIYDVDVFYMLQLQVDSVEDELKGWVKNAVSHFRIDKEFMGNAKPDCCVLHPLPRGVELPESVDSDPRAVYFEQNKNGLYVCMAVLEEIALAKK